MKVMKFGGATIGKPQRMKYVADLIKDDKPKIVVLSALSSTTTTLAEIGSGLEHNDLNHAKKKIEKLHAFYISFTESLLQSDELKQKALEEIEEHFQFLKMLLKISFSEVLKKDILAQGELISSALFSAYLLEAGIEHQLIPALDFMQLDAFGEPLVGNIKVKLTQLLNKHKEQKLFITQGSICRNSKGEIDNLKRGGSDYTAALIAAAINAETCEIWTDIEALQNNNASVVDKTFHVEQMSFEEAAELAYFGSKILHPHSLWPAKRFNIPVKVRNVTKPGAPHTTIETGATNHGVKAIASRDNITAIKIRSNRMLLAYGFIKKVVEIFENHETSIDMITTSEVSISLTVDNNKHLEKILNELEQFGTTDVDNNQCLITIVGNNIMLMPGIMKKIFDSIGETPVRMIGYGGSTDNISLLVKSEDKNEVLQMLNQGLFNL